MTLIRLAQWSLLSVVGSLAVISLDGCSFNRQVILKNSEFFSAPAPTKTHAVCFKGFSDGRSDSTIGYLQNMAGMKVRNIFASNSVTNWINTEVRNRLSLAGYAVDSSCNTQRPSISISGRIQKVSTTAKFHYLAGVILETELGTENGPVLKRNFTGYYDGSAVGLSYKAESFGKTLQGALDNAAGKLLITVDSLNSAPRDSLQGSIASEQTVQSIQSSSVAGDSADTCCSKMHDGITILSGNREEDSVQWVVRRMTSHLKSMYADQIKSSEVKAGIICARFIIKPDGKTDDIRIVRQTLNDRLIENSLLQAITKLQFGSIGSDRSGSSVTQAAYSISFDPVSAKRPGAGMGALWVLCMLVSIGGVILGVSNLSKL